MTKTDAEWDLWEERRLKRVAFLAVVVSTVAVISSAITLPLVYTFVRNFKSHLSHEMDFCKSRTKDMWFEMFHIHTSTDHNYLNFGQRKKREWLFGRFANAAAGVASLVQADDAGPEGPSGIVESGINGAGAAISGPYKSSADQLGTGQDTCPQSCTCGQGPPGTPGPPGDPGNDGKDGNKGKDGGAGKDGQAACTTGDPCQPSCMPGPPGVAGPVGEKGPQGLKGANGAEGVNGKRGERGMVGPEGPPGKPGTGPGPKGPPGDPGLIEYTDGPTGPPGTPGGVGPTGIKGPPGPDGKPGPKIPEGQPGGPGDVGIPGVPGPPGPKGNKGTAGDHGPCDHCPPPRTPPGYKARYRQLHH